jgi:hypothetical protein
MHAIDEDLNQHTVNAVVWTGTGKSGTATNSLGVTGYLGDTSFLLSLIGRSMATNALWTDTEADIPNGSNRERLYGISQVLTVPGATTVVPEPSTAIVAVFGAVAFIAYGWSRHRRGNQGCWLWSWWPASKVNTVGVRRPA